MRMSDWSSDVCSSDLRVGLFSQRISRNSLVAKEAGVAEDDPTAIDGTKCAASGRGIKIPDLACREPERLCGLDDREGKWMLRYPPNRRGKAQQFRLLEPDRKNGGKGKRVSVRVDPSGRRIIKTKIEEQKKKQRRLR